MSTKEPIKAKERINETIITSSECTGKPSGKTSTSGVAPDAGKVKRPSGKIRIKPERLNVTTQNRRTKAPLRVLNEITKAKRNETKINATEIRRQLGISPETEFMLKQRRGPKFNDNDTLLLLKMYQWLNGQSINYKDVHDPNFFRNKMTGERGAVVVGYVNEKGESVIQWPELAADFYGLPKPKGTKDVANIKQYTDMFRRTVNDLCNKKEKQFIGVYDEKTADGRNTRIYKIICPMNFHYSQRDGITYAVIQLDDYFTGNGNSTAEWHTYTNMFFYLIHNMKCQQATVSFVIELMMLTATSKAKATIDKYKTQELRRNSKGNENAFVMVKKIKLERLLKTISPYALEKAKYGIVHMNTVYALRNAIDLGILYDFGGESAFKEWLKYGHDWIDEKGKILRKPSGYKTYTDFYKDMTLTLYIKKEF